MTQKITDAYLNTRLNDGSFLITHFRKGADSAAKAAVEIVGSYIATAAFPKREDLYERHFSYAADIAKEMFRSAERVGGYETKAGIYKEQEEKIFEYLECKIREYLDEVQAYE